MHMNIYVFYKIWIFHVFFSQSVFYPVFCRFWSSSHFGLCRFDDRSGSNNIGHAHHIFCNHSRLELLKIGKIRFNSCYLTFSCLLKVKEELASLVSSESWHILKDKATSAFGRHYFQKAKGIVLDGQFWAFIRYVLQFTKPIYNMIRFANID